MLITDTHVYFYGSSEPYSNWFKRKMIVNNIEFNCNEQYMMYMKAMLFNDQYIANKILASKNPRDHKALGQSVRCFKQKVWDEKCEDIVYTGALAKFSQSDLKSIILNTDNKILVEASLSDVIWGVGLSENDPNILDESKWLGKNKLGNVLMKVRNTLRNQNKVFHTHIEEISSRIL